MRKIVCATVFMSLVLTLLARSACASQAKIFGPYSGMVPYVPGGNCTSLIDPNVWAKLNLTTGQGQLNVGPLSSGPARAWARMWVSTGWYNFTLATQQGRVLLDVWLDDSAVLGNSWIRIWLFMSRYVPGQVAALSWWKMIWSRPPPGPGSFALTIASGGIPLIWNTGVWYRSDVVIEACAPIDGVSHVSVGYARFDDILWIADASSPEEGWIPIVSPFLPNPPQICLNPPTGEVGTNVTITGQNFARESWVSLFWDQDFLTKCLTDASYGNFSSSFIIPAGTTGPHNVTANDTSGDYAWSGFFATAPVPPLTGDITGSNPGVPDGRVTMDDVMLTLFNFGKTDPNVDPPEDSKSVTNISPAVIALASVLVLPLLHKRRRDKEKARTQKV
jgi:hypothetical protein